MNLEAQTTEPVDVVAHQVRRMECLRRYPKGEDAELIRVVRQSIPKLPDGKPNMAVLYDVVSGFIEEAQEAPMPSDLRTALLARKPDEEPEWVREPYEPQTISQFLKDNSAIMERARQYEREQATMRRRIKHALGIHDFLNVQWGRVLHAKDTLGYPLTALEREDMMRWREGASKQEMELRPERSAA